MDICHPSDRSLAGETGCPDSDASEGSDRRMAAIGWPCLTFRVAPGGETEEPRRREASEIGIHNRQTGCPDTWPGKHLIGHGFLGLHHFRFRFDPDPSMMPAFGKRHRSDASHFFPGCPGGGCLEIPDELDGLGKVLASGFGQARPFHKGSQGEHQIGGSRPHHRVQVALILMIGGSEWAFGIRQEGPGCGARVAP